MGLVSLRIGWGRRVLGPTWVTGIVAALTGIALTGLTLATGPVASGGWLLTWLLLGLTAGYALSGSP